MSSSLEAPSYGCAGDAQFDDLARELFRLHYIHNPVYRRFCEARHACPERTESWKGIPALPTAAFKQFEVTCLAPIERTRTFLSSRTTGAEPSRNFHSPETLSIYEQSLWFWFRHCVDLRSAGGAVRVVILTPAPPEAPDSSLVHMLEYVRKQLDAPPSAFVGAHEPDQGWQVKFEVAVARLRQAAAETTPGAEAHPVLVMGTAFSFVHLLDFLDQQGMTLALPKGSRVFETGGYKGQSRSLSRQELHSMIREKLAVGSEDIVSEYGMSELASQAYDILPGENRSESSRIFRFPPWARATVINPETGGEAAPGEAGLLRILDLANVGAVLALQTEDIGVSRDGGFALVGRAADAEPKGCSLLVAG